jgi:predicted molibdopterin-dependent oxidoreductase YjgC
MCLVNLALLIGNIGKPGTGINPLRGQNNVQGAAHMGCDPGILTGNVSLNDAAIGYDIALTNANTTATEQALRSLDFVIIQVRRLMEQTAFE